MELPSASWVNLALQIPLALVIVVLTIYFLKHLEKTNKETNDMIQATSKNTNETIQKTTESMLTFMTQQANINREFLKMQQEMHTHGITRLAEEIKSDKVETVKELSALTQRVDGVIDKAIMLERLLPEKRQ